MKYFNIDLDLKEMGKEKGDIKQIIKILIRKIEQRPDLQEYLTNDDIPNLAAELNNYVNQAAPEFGEATIVKKDRAIFYLLLFLGLDEMEVLDKAKNLLLGTGAAELTSITIPQNSNVKALYNHSFAYCNNLQSCKIETTNIATIPENCFLDDNSLTEVYLPNSIKIIDDQAFYSCDNLKDIYYNGTIEDWRKIHFGKRWKLLSGLNSKIVKGAVHCTDGDINYWENLK